MKFATFMASAAGRGLRALAGVIFLVLAFVSGGAAGWILGLAGIFLVVVAALNVCVLAPLFGGPFKGEDIAA